MTQQAGTFQRVTVAEAAAILRVSPATVRRLVKAGKLTGERVIRPQGSAFVVLLSQVAAWVVTLMAPLAEANTRQHVTIERQAGEVADLREERGRLSVEVVEAKVRLVEALAEREATESSRRRIECWFILVVAVLAALLALMLAAPVGVR